MSTNKTKNKRGDSKVPQKNYKKLILILLYTLSKPTNILQLSYFTDKLAFNQGKKEELTGAALLRGPPSRGSIAIETSQCSAGLWGNTGEKLFLGISFLLRNRSRHITLLRC